MADAMAAGAIARYCGHGVRIISASAPLSAASASAAAVAFLCGTTDAFTAGSCRTSLASGNAAIVASDGEFFTEAVLSLYARPQTATVASGLASSTAVLMVSTAQRLRCRLLAIHAFTTPASLPM